MKTAYDLKHVKGTTAIVLLRQGTEAGKIVANWSDNPNGTVCTATVYLYGPSTYDVCPLGHCLTGTGKAGGYGYDKLSQAIYDALKNMQTVDNESFSLTEKIKVRPGAGNQREAFTDAGYTFIEVC